MGIKITLTREQVEGCVALGLGNGEAAIQLGISVKVYRRWLRAYGLSSPKIGRVIEKAELEECMQLGYGEKRASKHLKVGVNNYRRWMHNYGLKTGHPKFDNKIYWSDLLTVCTQCGKHNCVNTICGYCRKKAK